MGKMMPSKRGEKLGDSFITLKEGDTFTGVYLGYSMMPGQKGKKDAEDFKSHCFMKVDSQNQGILRPCRISGCVLDRQLQGQFGMALEIVSTGKVKRTKTFDIFPVGKYQFDKTDEAWLTTLKLSK